MNALRNIRLKNRNIRGFHNNKQQLSQRPLSFVDKFLFAIVAGGGLGSVGGFFLGLTMDEHDMGRRILNVVEGTMTGCLFGMAIVTVSPIIVPVYLSIKLYDTIRANNE